MNASATRTSVRAIALAGSFGVLLVAPAAVLADPPAVGAPGIPPVFIGARTNDNPNAGQFTVNFASTGTYLGTGSPEDPPLTRDLTPSRSVEIRQARASAPRQNAYVDRLFVSFKEQLRANAVPETASISR